MLSFFLVVLFFLMVFLLILSFWNFFKKSFKKMKNSKKNSNSYFECGFESSQESRQSFSLRFFFLLILFMMFDVELGLLLQFPFFPNTIVFYSRIGFFLFFFIMFVGLLEEWRRGLLNWKN